MNKDRRKRILNIIKKIRDNLSDLDIIQDEEQNAFDNLPEGLQYSSRGEDMENAIDAIATAISDIGGALDDLEGEVT